jgi:hypothetical protein
MVSEIDDSRDILLLVNTVCKALPADSVREIARNAYANNIVQTMPLLSLLAGQLNDGYIKAIDLLWSFEIPYQAALHVLSKPGLENAFEKFAKGSDARLERRADLCELLLAVLPLEELKELTCAVYANNIIAAKPIVNILFQKTGNRYFKAIKLFWKFQLFIPVGLIILGRIDSYTRNNLSNFYIDFCIYKDIFGAVKTGNSNFLKS